MKNHFYIAYHGNKTNEAEYVYKLTDFNIIDTVIEPFCGSCAISYYIWLTHPDIKFILNDNNKYLSEMFEIMNDETNLNEFNDKLKYELEELKKNGKEHYRSLRYNKNIIEWFINNKYYSIRPGIYPLDSGRSRSDFSFYDIKSSPVYSFFTKANIKFTNIDGVDVYNEYTNNKNTMIFLDPPYISSCNGFYINPTMNIYESLSKDNIENMKAKIIFILEHIFIVKELYNKYLINEYNK